MSLEALQALRAKYPQYDSIPDQELAQRVIAQYPQYQDALGDIAAPTKTWGETIAGIPHAIASWATEVRPPERTGSYMEEAFKPLQEGLDFNQMAEQARRDPQGMLSYKLPVLWALRMMGMPFSSVGNVVEKGAEDINAAVSGKAVSTGPSRIARLVAELAVPADLGIAALSKLGKGEKALEATKILEEAGVPAAKVAEAVAPVAETAAPVRPLSVSELLNAAKQSQNPVAAETLPERILTQAKNIDVGAHTPSIFDTAEDLVRRKHYTPVEERALFEPGTVQSAEYTQRELEAMAEKTPSKAEKLQAYREKIGLAPKPEETLADLEKAAAVMEKTGGADTRPMAQRLLEWASASFRNKAPWFANQSDHYLTTILSRLEKLGPQGIELSRLEQRENAVKSFLFHDLFEDLYRELHGLPDAEAEHLIDVIQNNVVPESQKIADLANHWTEIWGPNGRVVNAFRAHGIEISPREDFFPREFSAQVKNAILNDKEYQSNLISQIAQANGISRREAALAVRSIVGPKRVLGANRKISAEYARTVDLPDFIKVPSQVVALRGDAIARRLAEVMVYGPKDVNVMQAITSAPRELQKPLYDLFTQTIRRNPIESGLAETQRKVMTFQALAKLPLAFIPNSSQFILGGLRTDFSTLARGFLRAITAPGQSAQVAQEVGMAVDMIVRRNLLEMSQDKLSKAAGWALGPFNITERAIRTVAAQEGVVWANKLQGIIERGTDTPWLRRELGNLLFDKNEIARIMATKELTDADRRLISYAVAEQIAFVPRAARRSEAMMNPRLAVLLQFKSFLSNGTRLLNKAVMDDARRGNIRPLYHLLSIGLPSVVVGEVVNDMRALFRGSERPPMGTLSQLGVRALDNVLSIGTFGVGMDLINAAGGGASGLLQWAAGPTYGDLSRLGFRAVDMGGAALRGDAPEMGRQAYETGRMGIRQVPIIGGYLANRAFPTSVRQPAFPDETYWDRIGFTERARARARYLAQQRQNQSLRGFSRIFGD